MKLGLIVILLSAVLLVSTSSSFAQDATDAAQKADDLRFQLLDVQAKEAELQERARQLDEDLKPENISQSLAGIGSTRPEELRERRRRQLQLEKDTLQAQLQRLATTRANLESAIATADIDAYHQSAKGTSSATLDQMLLTQFTQLPKWVTFLILTLLMALGIVLLIVVRRLLKARQQGAVEPLNRPT